MLSPRKFIHGCQSVVRIVNAAATASKKSKDLGEKHETEKHNAGRTCEKALQTPHFSLSGLSFLIAAGRMETHYIPRDMLNEIYREIVVIEKTYPYIQREIEKAAKNITTKARDFFNPVLASRSIDELIPEFQELVKISILKIDKSFKEDIESSFRHIRSCTLNHDPSAAINEIDKIRQLTWRAFNPEQEYPEHLNAIFLSTEQQRIDRETLIEKCPDLSTRAIFSYGQRIHSEFTQKLCMTTCRETTGMKEVESIAKDARKKEKTLRKLGYDTTEFTEQIRNAKRISKDKKSPPEELAIKLQDIWKSDSKTVLPLKTQ